MVTRSQQLQVERYTVLAIPPGALILAVSRVGIVHTLLCGRSMAEARALAAERHPGGVHDANLLPVLRSRLHDYFAGRRVSFADWFDRLHLPSYTSFAVEVLRACAAIPYGATLTYGGLAGRVGRPNAARAVGQIMARNPVPILVPCHRVLAADGGLCGFSAEQGLTLKRWLLDLEQGRPRPVGMTQAALS